MKKNIIGTCPICKGGLIVSELTCTSCNTKINGEFNLSRFDSLSIDQQNFALVFIKNEGNIKLIEKELNISYPTVKKNLSDLINALGFEEISVYENKKMTKEEILESIKNKSISLDEAYKLLKEIEDE